MVHQIIASSLSENRIIGGFDALNALARNRNDALAAQIAQLVPPREMAAYLSPQQPVQIAATGAQAATFAQTVVATHTPRELALLANDVYQARATPPAGYRVATPADLAQIGLRPGDLAPASSNFRAQVYMKGPASDPQYVVSFRGTEFTSLADWTANARQAAGLPSDHYSRALAIGRQIARSGVENVTFTGHSLGGGLASAAAIASGRNATTFNAAGLSENTIESARNIRDAAGIESSDNVTAYTVRGDILTMMQDGGDRILGGLLGAWVGGVRGGMAGYNLADAPEAYGNRIKLDAVRPEGLRWYQDNPVARHGMDWVLSSLDGR